LNVSHDAQDDWELLERYRAHGSQDAFATIVRRHGGLVYHACRRRLRDAHLAEDAAQAVFVLLARRGPQRGAYGSLAGWLYRTAHHACANAMRARNRRARHERAAAESASASIVSGPSTDDCELILEDAMASLGSGERELLVMRFYEDRDLRELGQALGISQNTAAKRVSRAVNRLRKSFASRGAIVPAASVGPMLIEAMHRDAAPEVVNHLLSGALLPTAGPAVESIVKGVIEMLVRTKLKLAATTIGVAIMGGGLLSVTMLFAQTPAAKPLGSGGVAAATQPATNPAPKQVLKQFAAAVRAGDAQKLTTLTAIAGPEDQQLVDAACSYVTATSNFRKAVAAKFGAAAERELATLFELTPVGRFALLIETTVDKAPETIEGDTAMIHPPEIDDLTFWLVKDASGQWKLSSQRMTENWTPQQREERLGLMHMAAMALARFTENITDGKYANMQELKAELGPIVRQNR
jgi:RNA polymerase sigma factor (sigma-70 family)